MMESSTFRDIWNQGWERGHEAGTILAYQQTIITILLDRFGKLPPAVTARVQTTTDVYQLSSAVRKALHVSVPDELYG